MAKFPEPDLQRLARTEPLRKVLPEGTRLWRLYKRGGTHPVVWNQFRFFGPLNARFDHIWIAQCPETRGATIMCCAKPLPDERPDAT